MYLIFIASFFSDGLVIFQKPYGISKELVENKKNKYGIKINEGLDFYIKDCLPDIAKELNYESLVIIKSTERYVFFFFFRIFFI